MNQSLGIPCDDVSNVLSEEKKQQVIALGQLGWSLRRIEATVNIRRETISGYLRAAGIEIRPPGGWGRLTPAKPAIEVITDSAMGPEVITDSGPPPSRSPSPSACEPFRDLIELGLSRGRNVRAIWQDLVDQHGFKAGYQSALPLRAQPILPSMEVGKAPTEIGTELVAARRSVGRYD